MFTEKNKDFNDISKDAKKVKNDAIRVKDEAVSYAKENSDTVISEAKSKAREAGKNVYDFFKSNKQKLIDAEETASRKIKNNPLTSASVLLASGFILGSLFSRASSRPAKRSRRD